MLYNSTKKSYRRIISELTQYFLLYGDILLKFANVSFHEPLKATTRWSKAAELLNVLKFAKVHFYCFLIQLLVFCCFVICKMKNVLFLRSGFSRFKNDN